MKKPLKPMRYFIIFSSFIIAWVLTITPVSETWNWMMPEWMTMMLIYWSLREPERVGVATGWGIGLLMDVMKGSVLGQYAVSMAIIVYLAQLFKHRMPLFPLWQQAIVILVLVGFGQLTLLMVQWIMGRPPASLLFWCSTFTSMLIWPWMTRVTRFYERKLFFNVN